MNMDHLFRPLAEAAGYLELGMHDESEAVLNDLPADQREMAEAFTIRIVLAIEREDWVDGLTQSERAMALHPDHLSFHIHHAYALHELGYTLEAFACLERVALDPGEEPPRLATYHYNQACYAAVLGSAKLAMDQLHEAFSHDPRLRKSALAEPDLATLRHLLC